MTHLADYAFYHEFPPQPNESMVNELRTAIGGGPYYHGFLKIYHPSFFRPTRILNFIYVYLMTPFWVWRSRKSVSIAVTAPPGIQLWLAVWCKLFGAELVVWLMDYHPEIEARMVEQLWFGRWAAQMLRIMDTWALKNTRLVIALDRAMEACVKRRCPQVAVVVHPTWASDTLSCVQPKDVAPQSFETLTVVHIGNLGRAHDLSGLKSILKRCDILGRKVNLQVIGGSQRGNARFRSLVTDLSISLEILPRLPYSQVQQLMTDWQVAFGLVSLKQDLAGLVSPSKFSTYLSLGLPILYCGPPDTNAYYVCTQFGGGAAVTPDLKPEQLESIAQALFDPSAQMKFRAGTSEAARYFSGFNAQTLANLLRTNLGESVK